MGIRTIPSLVIGLGGTGKRALTHLKRRVYDTYGVEELPWIRLLSIDADSAAVNNPPVVSQTTGEFVNLGNSEMRLIDQSDTPQVISSLDAPENRHILDWYPDPQQKVDFPKAARGSGQVRMFGRIGLYKGDNLHTTYRWLQQASHDVSDPASWEQFPGFEVDPKLQFVYVICSLCGGTGSGTFLDVAYLLRKIVGVDPSTRRFIGMFVMPEVYEPVVENAHIKRIYANTYAALRELDFLMNSPKRSYVIRGKDHTFVDFPRDVTPFDFVFLFSNKNKRGAVISQRQVSGDKPVAVDDRVSQYISETIMTDVLSPVAERSESILSNIFTSLAEPEQMGDRTFYKSYSAVGVASVKVSSINHFKDVIELRLRDAVIDFLLRPDPEVTEKTLARAFFNGNVGKTEDALILRSSLSNDPAYSRLLSRAFREELKANRPAQVDKLSQWIELVLGCKIDASNCLESERAAVAAAVAAIEKVKSALSEHLSRYVKDHEHGFAFTSEWLQELIGLAKSKLAQLPELEQIEGNPHRAVKEALESFRKVGSDFQLPLMRDTLAVLMDRVADYYDERGRDERGHALVQWFYQELIGCFESTHIQLQGLVDVLAKMSKEGEEEFNRRVAAIGDTSQERVLIDKPLIGRREVEPFINGLLASLWHNSEWKDVVPVFSDEVKGQIDSELSTKVMETQLDASLDSDSKRELIETQIKSYVSNRLFDKLFPIDRETGRRKEPPYTTPDGKSLLLDFAGENLIQMLVAHSTPLWFVQTHELGSASQPIAFVGLNGMKIPDKVVDTLKKYIPTFRPTDIVLSDVEPRVLIKQYDPLYCLASLTAIDDYENYYKNTDRRSNPMHTDLRFVSEPNLYMQWLSYKSPADEAADLAAEARVVSERAERDRQVAERLEDERVALNKARADRQMASKALKEQAVSERQPAVAVNPAPAVVVVEPQEQPQTQIDTSARTPADGTLGLVRRALSMLKVVFCDRNPDVVRALQVFFSRLGEEAAIEISQGNVLELNVPALVVPTNSFGILDRGLALAVNKHLDGELEPAMRRCIQEKYAGELAIGSAEVLETGVDNPAVVVVAPTVRVPLNMMATNVNSYLATRAALLALGRYLVDAERLRQIKLASVAFAGMGTGGGRLAPATAAFQMYEAYCQIMLGQEPNFATIEAALAYDQELKKNRFM